MEHRSMAELTAYLPTILDSPADSGRVDVVVRRPAVDKREVLDEAELDDDLGLVGDSWRERGGDAQLTLVNARLTSFLGRTLDERALIGDPLHVDLDLTEANLPVGARLAVGTAVVEVAAKPHRGCKKLAGRYGLDALRFVNDPHARHLRLRGLNARVVESGTVRTGDPVTKLDDPGAPGG